MKIGGEALLKDIFFLCPSRFLMMDGFFMVGVKFELILLVSQKHHSCGMFSET